MSDNSKIDWCDATWNPIAGCSKCSPGCLNCYAERFAWRLYHHSIYYDKVVNVGGWTGEITCLEHRLNLPLHWHQPRRIFVCSMSDLFHPKVPFEFITCVHDRIDICQQHTFLILTKRIERAKEYYLEYLGGKVPENVHLGVSISSPDELWKVDELKKIPAAVRWLSLEPLLAGIEFTYDRLYCDRDPEEDSPVACVPCLCGKHWENAPISGTTLNCIEWVVVGCESGPHRRPFSLTWVESIVKQCKVAGVPVFVKQIIGNFGKVVKMPKGWPQEYPKERI